MGVKVTFTKALRRNLITLAIIYGAALIAVFIFQRDLLYFPQKSYVSPQPAYADSNLKEVPVQTEDGLKLIGWYAPATNKKLTIIYFHGNGDSLQTTAMLATPYIAAGFGFMLAEYRGYSKLPGSPTEAGLYADGRAYLHYLIASGVPENQIILMAHSLGTGVATQMATEFHAGGLILLAPYLSMAKMAQLRFPIFPSAYLTKDRFDNENKIATIHMPLLIVNGDQDKVIPPTQGKSLFAMANEPKQFTSLASSGHNDLFESDLVDVTFKWLDTLK